ncbi:MAG TPA: translation initiation factor IF-6 [Nanoarchaeota archaeon]|nr:translation initiation factor IF-6 [Nanoarchaeota archaeon]
MKFKKININGDPNIGLRGFATDSYALIGCEIPEVSILKTEIYIIKIAQTELSGIFAAGNSNGVILPKIAEKNEIAQLKNLDLNILILDTKETAIGNLILCNDKGCVISPLLKNNLKEIESCLGCETIVSTIAGLSITGSCGIATNKGCLLHRDVKEEEAELIEDVLKVKVDIGSVGGSPFVKSGIIANSYGLLIGDHATGPELERIFEVFE